MNFHERKIENTTVQPSGSSHKPQHQKMSPLGYALRFIGAWFGFTGLYATFNVCPFCGQVGCPVGLASAGAMGAFFALFVQDWKRLLIFIRHKLVKSSYNEKNDIGILDQDATNIVRTFERTKISNKKREETDENV